MSGPLVLESKSFTICAGEFLHFSNRDDLECRVLGGVDIYVYAHICHDYEISSLVIG